MPGYHKPYRLDITDKQGGLLVYIKSHLPPKLLSIHNTSNDIQVIPFELNLRTGKWMFMCVYRPPKQNSQYFLENLSSLADHYSSIYDNYIFLGDFNMEPDCLALRSFMQSFNLFNLIKTNTCFKGKGTCIDRFKREESKHFIYRDYKKFNDMNFRKDLENKLGECPKHYENFEKTFVNVLDAHPPRKTKVLRGNHKPHVDKNLHKAIMKRSKFKNKANRTKLQEDIAKYKKQRNLVVKLNRDSKLRYFHNIEVSKNSKPFWNVCKPYFSNKHAHGDSKIILIENEKITNISKVVIKKETLLVSNDEIAKTFNKHFAETVETLNTFAWPSNNTDLLNDQLTAIIKKCRNHPSIIKLKSKHNFQEKFSFKPVPVKYVESIIKNIHNNRAAEEKYLYIFLNNPVLLTKC